MLVGTGQFPKGKKAPFSTFPCWRMTKLIGKREVIGGGGSESETGENVTDDN